MVRIIILLVLFSFQAAVRAQNVTFVIKGSLRLEGVESWEGSAASHHRLLNVFSETCSDLLFEQGYEPVSNLVDIEDVASIGNSSLALEFAIFVERPSSFANSERRYGEGMITVLQNAVMSGEFTAGFRSEAAQVAATTLLNTEVASIEATLTKWGGQPTAAPVEEKLNFLENIVLGFPSPALAWVAIVLSVLGFVGCAIYLSCCCQSVCVHKDQPLVHREDKRQAELYKRCGVAVESKRSMNETREPQLEPERSANGFAQMDDAGAKPVWL